MGYRRILYTLLKHSSASDGKFKGYTLVHILQYIFVTKLFCVCSAVLCGWVRI